MKGMFVIVIATFVSLVLFAQVGSDFQSKLKETLHISGSLKNSFRYFTTFPKEKNLVYILMQNLRYISPRRPQISVSGDHLRLVHIENNPKLKSL